ncbi:MAG: hypothetical protein K5928_00770 [Prevotella sp.]|nr:hypothetical protein [Prevotella sp.]
MTRNRFRQRYITHTYLPTLLLTAATLSIAPARAQQESTGVRVMGNVFGAGKGLDNDANAAKVHVGSTVSIASGHVYGHVYGGGEMSSVGNPEETQGEKTEENPFGYATGTARVTIDGTAQIGTDSNCMGEHATGGYVYGSGLGKAGSVYSDRTYVKNTIVTIGGTAKVRGSVFGSGENGHVRHDTRVNIQDDCEIGTELTTYTVTHTETNEQGEEVQVTETINEHEVDADGQGAIIYRGNVYGGGRGVDHTVGDGTHYSLSAGRVYGNTEVNITGGKVFHDVFGGGSLATVGTATYDDNNNITAYTAGTGKATVNISGGIVGYSLNTATWGRNCGFVYGGCRGLAARLTDDAVHMAYVHDTEVTISGTAMIKGSVFGGGANGHVQHDTHVNISGGNIGEPLTDDEAFFDAHGLAATPIFRGNVYAGGRGVDHYGDGDEDLSLTAGRVFGNASLTMTGGHVWHNIYGAGSMASVGTVERDDNNNIDFLNGTWDPNTGHITIDISGGIVGDNTLTGGTISEGITATKDHPGRNNGRVYGAGRGVSAGRSSRMAAMQYVYDTEVNISGTAYIYGAVFGGGENGHVRYDTHVNINGGVIGWPLTADECHYNADGTATNPWRGHVYGGGRGVDPMFHDYAAGHSFTAGRVYGNTNITMTGGLVRRAIYGGGLLASVGNYTMEDADQPDVNIDEDDIQDWHFDESLDENGQPKNKNGVATITISGGYIGNVNTDGTMIAGTALTGTDKPGRPGYNNGHVYGSGCGMVADALEHDEQYSQMGYVYRSVVTIDAPAEPDSVPHIRGSVFGSGENGHVWENTHVTINGGIIGADYDEALDTDQHRFLGNVYGSGRGVDHTEESTAQLTHISRSAGKVAGNTNITINGGEIWNDIYGGGSMASVGDPDENLNDGHHADGQYHTGLATVVVQGTSVVHGSVYGSGRGIASTNPDYQQAAFIKNSDVQILGSAHIYNNVYGGGNAGHVRKNTKVTIGAATGEQQPTIDGSVYGGGAGSTVSASAGAVNHNVEVNILGGTIEKNVYGGGAVANSNLHDQDNTATDNADCKEQCTTTVNLLGGLIKGDAYGGGEGVWNTANGDAVVFGDISVVLDGTRFNITRQDTDEDSTEAQTDSDGNPVLDDDSQPVMKKVQVVKSGRVFGANNLNGSPRGNVTVTVERTEEGNTPRTAADTDDSSRASRSADVPHTYEVAAVYGGGNLASFTTAGRTASVVINNCDVSIREVYGGGNAADVPATSVTVNGAWEIETVFGGGNGNDKYTTDGGTTWALNPGANVGGNATTLLNGGYIHEGYGGSNKKGTITGEVSITAGSNASCPLEVGKIVGAGKSADIEGDVILVMGCMPETKIPVVFAGANNANVYGDVELTVTSGNFGQVFAGNNEGGHIYGHIKLNVEETSCIPLNIDELYACGNLAAYSAYGYDATDGHPLTQAEYDALNTAYATALAAWNELTPEQQAAGTAPVAPRRYADPEVNVISCTSIGQVYGGGYGATAVVYANPTVNINMLPGDHAASIDRDGDGADGNAHALGTIGEVYGGGNAADLYGNTTVNIGTAQTVTLHSRKDDHDNYTETTETVEGARIVGRVFGGGNLAAVHGNTEVNICAVRQTVGDEELIQGVDYTDTDAEGVSINVVTSEEETTGMVFGGGNQADVTGNTAVNMAGGFVYNRIYGGGNIGSIGTITSRTAPESSHTHTGDEACVGGKPDTFATGTGTCTVNVLGGQVGPTGLVMPQDYGYVFGASRGMVENPAVDPDIDFRTYVSDTHVTIGGTAFITGGVYGGSENGRVRHDTHVVIAGGQVGCGKNATEPYDESVFSSNLPPRKAGGGEDEYDDLECASWPYGKVVTKAGKEVTLYLPYDPEATAGDDSDDADPSGSDGHTFYGNVFGGGSGFFPYELKDANGAVTGHEWLESAGLVEGDTYVNITGGHILTSVYGGNELTDVTGTCHVTMTGGTLGVPRTLGQIAAHPVTCYLFGAGKGDQRVHFNQRTNVGTVEVEVSGTARIFGSVFGGGEDGHVLGNTRVTIGNPNNENSPYIGNWGTSYVDGNIFGGGRGFGGDALTAGVVSGNVHIDIRGGHMLGSIYGGGRLGSVGTYLVPPADGRYGTFIPEGKEQNLHGDDVNAPGTTHGHITIAISGGTIGNDHEYLLPKAGDLTPAKAVSTWTEADWTAWKQRKNIPNTLFGTDGRLAHTKGGNVFAGAMGRLYNLDGKSALDHWPDMARARSTQLTVIGGTIKSCVYGGAELGTVGEVVSHTDGETVTQELVGGTDITITGGTIGTVIEDENSVPQYTFGSVFGGGYGSTIEKLMTNNGTVETSPKFTAGLLHAGTTVSLQGGIVRASVYGGGEVASVEGSSSVTVGGTAEVGHDRWVSGDVVRYFGGATMGNVYGGGSGHRNIVRCGKIFRNATVNITGGKIYHNVYGGGAFGTVGDFSYDTRIDPEYGTPKVYGVTGLNTVDTGTATVNITGGIIGTDGNENGIVFGSSRGEVDGNAERDDYGAYTYDTHVTIGTRDDETAGPVVRGSVYGSGENGHTFNNTVVNIHSGIVGIDDDAGDADVTTRGNVYGGGCGTDTYTADGKKLYNPEAGIVRGNATVNVTGGRVVRTVYGGGAMGSVGTFNKANAEYHEAHPDVAVGTPYECTSGGLCTVNISGGRIGPNVMQMPNSYGHVFGAGRGQMHDPAEYVNLETSGFVNATEVTISGTAFVKGSVYGGSESGHVLGDTWVKIQGGQVGCGSNTTEPYDETLWTADADPSLFAECVSWPYEPPYAPYDKFALADGNYPAGAAHENADHGSRTATDGHTFYGNVFGGGSGSTPYAPGAWLPSAGWVKGNTRVDVCGGHVLTSVYGGCEMSNVGTGISGDGGKATVRMSGGTIGVPRTLEQIIAHPVTCYLFGSGKGDQRIFFNKETNVKDVDVEISGGIIYGSVFGGGEDGHVLRDVNMTIKAPDDPEKPAPHIGTLGTSYVDGNVFGGGRGFSGEALTAGNVGGCVTLNIAGGTMLGSVYGGGRLGSVGYGLYLVDETVGGEKPYGQLRPDNVSDRGDEVPNYKRGYITINISGGTIGNDREYIYNPTAEQKAAIPYTSFDSQNRLLYTKGGNVFTGCMGRLYALDGSLLLQWPKLGHCKQTELNISGGTIKSNVYGGAELGAVQQNATVNITGGTIGTKVASSSDPSHYYYYGSAFGGGKGSTDAITYPAGTDDDQKTDISKAGSVYGDVVVNLNEGVAETARGGVVRKVFGCNDTNGSPRGTATVNVYATQNEAKETIADKYATGTSHYDMEAVYGGGNLAAYEPAAANSATHVNIYGCGLSSIETVYGGGNAAATPATNVDIFGTHEIDEVFGGGNGKDNLPDGRSNPGANVGYKNYTVYTDEGGQLVAHDAGDADTKAKRLASAYAYGTGAANVTIHGGTVHRVYGGSNTKGNVRISAVTMLEDASGCAFSVDEAYGGGKSAPMDAEAKLQMACIPGLKTAYGGAEDAEIDGDVELTITNGTYDRVFGGNNVSGHIKGKITVNIEETGCKPLIIAQLYGGGNQAPYSPTTPAGMQEGITLNVRSFTSIGEVYGGGYGTPAEVTADTHVNINVSEGKYADKTYAYADGKTVDDYTGNKTISFTEYLRQYDAASNTWGFQLNADGSRLTTNTEATVYLPPLEPGHIGGINKVFGGGNAARVVGNTNVNIGTDRGDDVYMPYPLTTGDAIPADCYTRSGEGTAGSPYVYTPAAGTVVADTDYYKKFQVKGAVIRDNVYGGGNNADVTGNSNVVIGKRAE